LPDDVLRGAVRTPYCEGHFEAHDQGAFTLEVSRARAERMFVGELVGCC
jgi:hypothetical protein